MAEYDYIDDDSTVEYDEDYEEFVQDIYENMPIIDSIKYKTNTILDLTNLVIIETLSEEFINDLVEAIKQNNIAYS